MYQWTAQKLAGILAVYPLTRLREKVLYLSSAGDGAYPAEGEDLQDVEMDA